MSGYALIGAKLPDAIAFGGLIAYLCGVYLRHLAIKTLGRFFVTKVQVIDDHELVTTGIYNFIRHPSYTGLIFGFLGLLTFLQSGFATLIFLFIGIPAYLYRIKVEEKALFNKFGENFLAYRQRTYALLPLIY